jgi:RHS repeat-associated protein
VQSALTGNGSGLTGGTSPSVAVTVTSLGGDAGRVAQTTDPRGLVTKTDADWLGRTLRTVEDFSTFNPGNANDKTTEYSYDGSSHMLTLQADLAGGTYEQTKYVYGVTTGGGSGINSNDILGAMQYPDPTTGNPSSSQQESYTVNALGERLGFTDRNGNVHGYFYDVLGRPTSDQVTTLGSGVDGAVQRIDTAYNTQGNAYLFTSYSTPAGTTIVNQVQEVFNGLGQLTGEYQSHSGAVVVGTTPEVQYAYTEMAGGANNSRLVSMTYPNGRVLNYNYASGVDNSISRLTSLSDSTGTLESYSYLGLDTVVQRARPQINVNLTYIKQTGESNGDAGDQYTGLDRFGRVVDQRWINTSTGTATDRFQYGYDRDSNALWRNNVVNTAFGELYHTSGAGNGYDGLNQLTAFSRGVMSSSGNNGILDTIASPTHSQSYNMDGLGNFTSVTTDGTPVTRTNNQQNETTAVGSANLAYDKNGNTTTDDQGHTLLWDAWNRPVTIKSGTTVLETYAYDALNRRTVESSGTARDLYYSSAWQVLEEDIGGVMQAQYVWSPIYVDALVERDAGGARLWVQQEADWNTTALVNSSGNVVERYAYDPYGVVTYLSATWATLSSSAYNWLYLHQGGRLDTITGDYYFRNRVFSPTLMRWLNPDPLGLAAGDPNLYRAEGNAPASKTDYSGLRGLDLCEKCAAALFLPVVSSTAKKNLKGIINQTSIEYLKETIDSIGGLGMIIPLIAFAASDAEAITLPPHLAFTWFTGTTVIAFNRNCKSGCRDAKITDTNRLALVTHEMVHVAQIWEFGGKPFIDQYLGMYRGLVNAGLSGDDAYHCNLFEIQAYALQDALTTVLDKPGNKDKFESICDNYTEENADVLAHPDPRVMRNPNGRDLVAQFTTEYQKELGKKILDCAAKLKK